MKIRHTLALLAVLGMASVSNAAMRTFTIDSNGGGPALGPVQTTLNFSYPDGAFGNNVVNTGELTSTFGITLSGASAGSYQLTNIQHAFPTTRPFEFLFTFTGSDLSKIVMQLNGPAFNSVGSGADLPDGTEGSARSNYFSPTNVLLSQSFPQVTIGTAAVPEPSAFGFGALALAATGMGRWARRRFFAA